MQVYEEVRVSIGGGVQYKIIDYISLESGISYATRSDDFDFYFSGDVENPDGTIDLSYLEIPILAKLHTRKSGSPYFILGSSMGFLLSNNWTNESDSRVSDSRVKVKYKMDGLDVSLLTGLGFEISAGNGNINIDLMFKKGLKDLNSRFSATYSGYDDFSVSTSKYNATNKPLGFVFLVGYYF